VLGFQHQSDAERFRKDLADRLARFGLSLNADKTRLMSYTRKLWTGLKRRKAAYLPG
jgi:hypothetical protein